LRIKRLKHNIKSIGPDFIFIGLEKTGSSWLYKSLLQHSGIELPPIKEIRFFWERYVFGELNTVIKLYYNHLKHYNHWHFQSIRKMLIKRIRFHIYLFKRFKFNLSHLLWDINFFFRKHDNNWYLRLLSTNKLSGDISPQYAELPEKEITRIKKFLPNLKIILGLRDPIERAWSFSKMELCKKLNKELKEVSEDEFIRYVEQNSKILLFDYISIIKRWKKYFKSDNILIYFFEELKTDPIRLFLKICNFLGINEPCVNIKSLMKIVNKGIAGDVPSFFIKYLLSKNFHHYIEMNNYFSEKYPKEWYSKYCKIHHSME